MKTTLLAGLAFLVVVSAEAGPGWERMQEAVLRTQDIHKVEELLAAGVDINAPIGCGTYSPLDGAINTRNMGMFKFLLAHGARPKGSDLQWIALFFSGRDATEATEMLLNAGVSPNDNTAGSNASGTAVYSGKTRLVALLLSQPGINVDIADADGYTPLMWAAEHSSFEIADLLLKAGARVDLKNRHGETAATIAKAQIQKQ
ncbi:MAG: ankyrin repeat domain-containing protein [Chthoniobacter sp.]|nr:ankyrin repeat domain-containing protein [Chthoniobacter sp.]